RKKCQTPTPTTEYASVVLGVWQYGKAKGFAQPKKQEGRTSHQWRHVACCGRLGHRPADFRSCEGAWQYHMEHCRPDVVDRRLGVVERRHADRSVHRSPALVDRRARPCGHEELSRSAQCLAHLDVVVAAAAVGPSP